MIPPLIIFIHHIKVYLIIVYYTLNELVMISKHHVI